MWWILLWAREQLDKELKTNFNNSWLTHFIAVSWFNITILIIFFSLLIKFFPNYIKIILIIIFILIFVVLVWATAPVIRASIMWIIWYIIITLWRQWDSLAIILVTAVCMVIYSPLSLNHDISLHLSFLAVIWIIYTYDYFEKLFKFIPNILEARTAFVLTLSALSFSLPIIIFNFGQLSILSPIANLLVAWTIPISMLLWFISIIVYYIFPIFWIFIWYVTWIFLKWDMLIVEYFWTSYWAIIKIWNLEHSWYYQILYLITLIFIIIYFRKKI